MIFQVLRLRSGRFLKAGVLLKRQEDQEGPRAAGFFFLFVKKEGFLGKSLEINKNTEFFGEKQIQLIFFFRADFVDLYLFVWKQGQELDRFSSNSVLFWVTGLPDLENAHLGVERDRNKKRQRQSWDCWWKKSGQIRLIVSPTIYDHF